MRPVDLNDHPPDAELSAQVCVVGSGPAGAAVALELARSGADVVMLESGGYELEEDTNELYEIDNVGLPRVPQREVRVRQFGGTSTVWIGRCAPFRAIDHEARSWVPGSGWPVSAAAFEPYVRRAAPYLGLAPFGYGSRAWEVLGGKLPSARLDPSKLVDEVWQFSRGVVDGRPVRVQVDHAPRLRQAHNIRILLHANVTEIVPNPTATAVDHVVVRSLQGRRATVRAGMVVLCAGGIENARLLLMSRSVTPRGLGNDHDLVGRFFMEHPCSEVGTFDVSVDCMDLIARFGAFWHGVGPHRDSVFTSGIGISPRVQRERELLNCAMYLLVEPDEQAAIHALRRLASRSGHAPSEVRALLSHPWELAQAAWRRALDGMPPIPRPRRITVATNAEQMPDPSSRITLSDERDELGSPRARIDWRMHDLERETIRATFELFCEELRRLGMPTPEPIGYLTDTDDWRRAFVDTAHHSCATRMADDPRRGVTDGVGQVHGVDGLYVAGSSLFPTVGTANPTLMIVATALRAADAIRARLRCRPHRIRPTVAPRR